MNGHFLEIWNIKYGKLTVFFLQRDGMLKRETLEKSKKNVDTLKKNTPVCYRQNYLWFGSKFKFLNLNN